LLNTEQNSKDDTVYHYTKSLQLGFEFFIFISINSFKNMRSILSILLLLTVIVSGCSKGSNNNAPTKEVAPVPASPSAKFAVTLTINNNGVKEGDDVKFDNQSVNAASYLWDFGNGVTSADKSPTVTFACGQTSVKLTATATTGAISVYTNDLLVYCKGKNAGGKMDANGHVHTGNTGE
jgi:hypothetical protein